MNKFILFTNDVELTSIVNNTQSIKTGELVAKVGIPRLLEIYTKWGFNCTFFVTADYAKAFPDSVREISKCGHEVGSHGASHGHDDAFDRMSYNDQVKNLKGSKQILEDITGKEVVSFRAPALRVNTNTPKALIEAGFKIDSSVASQRFDFLFSFGSKNKLSWLNAPRTPYCCSHDSLSKRGASGILEIPLISYLYPYIGTTLRISPSITSLVRELINLEASHYERYPVFLVHPNELISEVPDPDMWGRRASNYIEYVIKEKLRSTLKKRNLGENAVRLLDRELSYFSSRKYRGIRLIDVYNMKIKENNNA